MFEVFKKNANCLTMDDAQDLRANGYYIVVNKDFSKVLLATKNKEEALEMHKTTKNSKYYAKMIKIAYKGVNGKNRIVTIPEDWADKQ